MVYVNFHKSTCSKDFFVITNLFSTIRSLIIVFSGITVLGGKCIFSFEHNFFLFMDKTAYDSSKYLSR